MSLLASTTPPPIPPSIYFGGCATQFGLSFPAALSRKPVSFHPFSVQVFPGAFS